MRRRRPIATAVLLAALFVGGLFATSGCGLFEEEVPDTTVSDLAALFHFKIPGEWQFRVEPGLIAVYSSQELPEQSVLESLSIIVLSGPVAEEPLPIEERLLRLVEARSEEREWEDAEIGEPVETSFGGRPGYRVALSGVDANSVSFAGEYYLVRTNDTEVLLLAVSPADQWDDDAPEVRRIVEDQWFWHRPDPSLEETQASE